MLSYDEMKNLMETLTLQEAVVLHRDLWNWIYEESLRIGRIVSKMEYFITFNKWFPISACWFCHYININKIGCNFCPGDWNAFGCKYCESISSPYRIYSSNIHLKCSIFTQIYFEETLQAIQQIRDIPIRWELEESRKKHGCI